jgi:hypothetical protein
MEVSGLAKAPLEWLAENEPEYTAQRTDGDLQQVDAEGRGAAKSEKAAPKETVKLSFPLPAFSNDRSVFAVESCGARLRRAHPGRIPMDR